MDISHTLAPRSDQLNNDDVVASPVTVTVTEVKPGPDDQPVHIHTEEYPGRPFKPSLTARRVIAAAWGTDTTQWVGKRMTLYSDPTVTWAGQQVGGIRISHMSDLEQPMKLRLTETRNKRKEHTVQPLSEEPAQQRPQQAPPQQQGPDIDAYIDQAAGDPEKVQQLYDWAKGNGAPEAVLDRIAASQQPEQREEGK